MRKAHEKIINVSRIAPQDHGLLANQKNRQLWRAEAFGLERQGASFKEAEGTLLADIKALVGGWQDRRYIAIQGGLVAIYQGPGFVGYDLLPENGKVQRYVSPHESVEATEAWVRREYRI